MNNKDVNFFFFLIGESTDLFKFNAYVTSVLRLTPRPSSLGEPLAFICHDIIANLSMSR